LKGGKIPRNAIGKKNSQRFKNPRTSKKEVSMSQEKSELPSEGSKKPHKQKAGQKRKSKRENHQTEETPIQSASPFKARSDRGGGGKAQAKTRKKPTNTRVVAWEKHSGRNRPRLESGRKRKQVGEKTPTRTPIDKRVYNQQGSLIE